MSTGAAGGGMFEGCISGSEMGISRRPYHRNCGCALHKSRPCPHASPSAQVSYPVRRTWSEGCLTLMASSAGQVSPCSSPAMNDQGLNHAQFPLFEN